MAALTVWFAGLTRSETAIALDRLQPGGIFSVPLAARTEAGVGSRFDLLPASQTGLDFAYRWNTAARYARLLNSSAAGGGVAVGDYDGDGLPDLCLTGPANGCRLYRNLGGFRFVDATGSAGLDVSNRWSTGVSFADINHDGRLDLYVCCYDSPNRLYLNRGQGRFEEQAAAFGVDFDGASFMMAFADYDRDGDLDGYLLTGGKLPGPAQRFRVNFVDGRPVVPDDLKEFWQLFYLPGERASAAEAGQSDVLYRNNGDGTFTDVSRLAGISGYDFGNAAIWWDYDSDGWPDLYVANDYFGPDYLYRNRGDGTFTNVTAQCLPYTPWTSMGADAGDLNNDGWMDLLASDMSGTTHEQRVIDEVDMARSGWFLEYAQPRQYMRNAVFINSGASRFLEVAYWSGLANTDWTWSILSSDLDGDGWLDVFVPNGMTRNWMDNDLAQQSKGLQGAEFDRFWRDQAIRADRNLVFRNLGGLQFEDVSKEWGLDHQGPSFGAVAADLDRDGDLDLVVNQFEAPVRIHRNQSTDHHRVALKLRGVASHRDGIGATLRIKTTQGTQARFVSLAHGFMSAGEPIVHFGLGTSPRVDRLTISWPSGRLQDFENLEGDRFYTIMEPMDVRTNALALEQGPSWFRRSSRLAAVRHEEGPFDDFSQQMLLPSRLSRLGPGMAWGDVDGDGVEELYVAGTRARPGTLYRRGAEGVLGPVTSPALAQPREVLAPLFLDANADGALDLYLVTGGVESGQGDEALKDVLLLGSGDTSFAEATSGVLPDLRESGSVALAGDFDRDGDLDIFVGGRCIPGSYPMPPPSRLLRNNGGRFEDWTAESAPDLAKAGLVTGAQGSDVNGDGWLDLVITCEWGPIRLYVNEGGRLRERTREAGLDALLGWWNGIAAGDLDRDGDIDFVVANLGRNTRYRPTRAEPVRVYFGDFGDSPTSQIVEAYTRGSDLFPVRGKGALEAAFPGLRSRFPSYRSFASARLTDLFPPEALRRAYHVEVNASDSGILVNDGRGRFAFRALPWLAQIAPVSGVVVADFDADGAPDIFLAQNSFNPNRDIGRMSGGVSVLMKGRGDGSFEPVWPYESGLVVGGDARSATTADLDGDGWLDLVVGVNDAECLAFENVGSSSRRTFVVTLRGRRGNVTAVGAHVTLQMQDQTTLTAEVYAGGGYLSQSSSSLVFGLGVDRRPLQIEVRWPNGQQSHQAVDPQARSAKVIQD